MSWRRRGRARGKRRGGGEFFKPFSFPLFDLRKPPPPPPKKKKKKKKKLTIFPQKKKLKIPQSPPTHPPTDPPFLSQSYEFRRSMACATAEMAAKKKNPTKCLGEQPEAVQARLSPGFDPDAYANFVINTIEKDGDLVRIPLTLEMVQHVLPGPRRLPGLGALVKGAVRFASKMLSPFLKRHSENLGDRAQNTLVIYQRHVVVLFGENAQHEETALVEAKEKRDGKGAMRQVDVELVWGKTPGGEKRSVAMGLGVGSVFRMQGFNGGKNETGEPFCTIEIIGEAELPEPPAGPAKVSSPNSRGAPNSSFFSHFFFCFL